MPTKQMEELIPVTLRCSASSVSPAAVGAAVGVPTERAGTPIGDEPQQDGATNPQAATPRGRPQAGSPIVARRVGQRSPPGAGCSAQGCPPQRRSARSSMLPSAGIARTQRQRSLSPVGTRRRQHRPQLELRSSTRLCGDGNTQPELPLRSKSSKMFVYLLLFLCCHQQNRAGLPPQSNVEEWE